MLKISDTYKFIIFITLIFIFLPSLYIYQGKIPCYDIIIAVAIFSLLFCKYKINNIIYLFRLNYNKLLIYFTFWIIISGCLLVILGKYNLLNYIYGVFLLFIYNNISWYVLPALAIPKIYDEKFIIKFIYLGIYIICIYGLIEYYLNLLNIGILEPVQSILVNRRLLMFDSFSLLKTRLYSVFEEPSALGSFLCVNLPIILKLSRTKYRIFKNEILNHTIKKTFIPVLFLTILGMQSPIWFIIFLLLILIYSYKQILKNFNKVIIILFCFCFIGYSCMIYKNIDISETFIQRIVKTQEAITNLRMLTIVEPSLATRIISYIIRIRIFKDNIITGVGYKNAEYHVFKHIKGIYLTRENIDHILENNNARIRINGSLITILLSDTGIIGFLLFFAFLLAIISKYEKIIQCTNDGIKKEFLISVRCSLINIICLSWYAIPLNSIYLWFLYGLINVFILNSKFNQSFRIMKGEYKDAITLSKN